MVALFAYEPTTTMLTFVMADVMALAGLIFNAGSMYQRVKVLEARVKVLESDKVTVADHGEEIATLKAQVGNLCEDFHQVAEDVRSLRDYLMPSRS